VRLIERIKRALSVSGLLLLMFYLGDYVSVQFKIPRRQLLDHVQVTRDFAVKDNDRTTEFTAPMTVNEECVVAIFPHSGDKPCWYLRRHTTEHLELDGGSYRFSLGQP
jgi:hypothetical protein